MTFGKYLDLVSWSENCYFNHIFILRLRPSYNFVFMKVNRYYTNRFETHYKLNVSVWKAFAGFLGFSVNLYDNAVSHIAKTSIKEALMADVAAVRQDGHKVLEQHGLHDPKRTRLTYAGEQE